WQDQRVGEVGGWTVRDLGERERRSAEEVGEASGELVGPDERLHTAHSKGAEKARSTWPCMLRIAQKRGRGRRGLPVEADPVVPGAVGLVRGATVLVKLDRPAGGDLGRDCCRLGGETDQVSSALFEPARERAHKQVVFQRREASLNVVAATPVDVVHGG